MLLANAAANLMLDSFGAVATWVSLHESWPAGTGANEVSTVTRAPYGRQSTNWFAAAAANLDNNLNPTISLGAGVDVQWAGLWSAATAGTFYGASPLGGGPGVPFTADPVTEIFTAPAHGLVNGQQVALIDTDVAGLPTGTTEGTLYFVIGVTTDTFQVSTTSGGSALNLTSSGAGFVVRVIPLPFPVAGSVNITDLDITLKR